MKITEDELSTLYKAKLQNVVSQLKAESAAIESGRAAAEARAAELEYENILLKIYLQYGLTNNHIINETTGVVKLKEENEQREQETNEGTKSEDDSGIS